MKKAFLKDSVKDVKNNILSYLSIVVIIMLGVAFFVGMNSISPDMKATAQKYLKDYNVYDFQIISNLGFNNTDLEKLYEIDEITNIEPSYIYDTITKFNEQNIVIRLNSYNKQNNLNQNHIVEGRSIQTSNECLIDTRLRNMYDYEIGDTIEIQTGTDTEITDVIKNNEYKIVGIITNPIYLSQYYGTTTLETGEVKGYVFINEEQFRLEKYNCAYISTNIDKNINKFSDEYKDKIQLVNNKIEHIAEIEQNVRYEEVVNEYKEKIEEAKKEVENAKSEIKEKENLITEAREELNLLYDETLKLSKMIVYKDNLYVTQIGMRVSETYKQLNISRNELSKTVVEFEREKEKAEKEIIEAEEEIANSEYDLENLSFKWSITGITEAAAFKTLENDLEKIGIMGKVFPVIFFVVAALVTITTVTRTIEENRGKLGTFKALGYKKSTIFKRYIIYSVCMVILGTGIGTIIGSYIITNILYAAYSSLYALPELVVDINLVITGIAVIISSFAILFFTIFIVKKELKENTAQMLRPKAGKPGKKILLEKMSFIWKKLSFLYKVSFRNIFRYKRRLLMTLVGIAGCTALIYTGVALKSSIDDIGEKQFGKIWTYDLQINVNGSMKKTEILETISKISEIEHIEDLAEIRQQSVTVEKNEIEKDIYYMVLESYNIKKYIFLNDYKTKQEMNLNSDGVIITEKLSKTLKINVGDTITIKEDNENVQAKVIGIAQNYLYNYMYMTPEVYEKIYDKPVEYNQILANIDTEDENEKAELSSNIKENNEISSTIYSSAMNKEYQTSLQSLMSIVFMCIGCAVILAFVVLFNLNNINIEERKRELATIKLLGFYDNEMYSYVFRENIIITIIGIIIGLLLGILVLGQIIQSAEVETIMLSREISTSSFVNAALITFICTLISNLAMTKKIRKTNMIESLKSVE